jgi:hypothetical protein
VEVADTPAARSLGLSLKSHRADYVLAVWRRLQLNDKGAVALLYTEINEVPLRLDRSAPKSLLQNLPNLILHSRSMESSCVA